MSNNREALAKFLLRLRSKGITDHRLISAFEAVPRRNFVPVIHLNEAYARGQMPIECGQVMTAASMVANVLSHLDVSPKHRVLELGTGTGYQTALLSHLGEKIVSVERFRTLHEKSKWRLEQLKIENAILKLMDGSKSGPEFGISDRVIANFAFEDIPRHFIDNIAVNGVMIAPIGPAGDIQIMKKMTKIGSRLQVEDLFSVRTQHVIPGISRAI